MSIEKLELMNPLNETINTAIKTEEISFNRLKNMLESSELEKSNISAITGILNIISKMRINQRSEISIKARIIKDISKDKDELNLYIKSTFPKFL